MIKIQNPKPLAFDLICYFRLYGLGICSSNSGIDNCPAGTIFSESSLAKSLVRSIESFIIIYIGQISPILNPSGNGSEGSST